jgi:hypothetical protein
MRSIGAVLAGIIVIVALSLGSDHLLHVLEVYPTWGQPMHDTGDNLLALVYRIVYGILGGYVTARLAPRAPMRHALILGGIGVVLSLLGAGAAITADLGPVWSPIALVITALPCAWAGGALRGTRHGEG